MRADEVFKNIEVNVKKAMQETLEKTALKAESELSRLFKTEGQSLNAGWSPLKEAYFKQKIKKGYSEKMLHRTTTLAQSFSSVVKNFAAVIGTPVRYAVFLEEGTTKMPQRAFMKPVADYLKNSGIVGKLFKEAINAK